MDQEKIDAMCMLVDVMERTAGAAASRDAETVATVDGSIPVGVLKLAIAGFRELVKREAERAAAAPLDDEDAKSLAVVVHYLRLAAESAALNGGGYVRISTEDDIYAAFPSTALAAVRAIEALTAARVTKPLEQTAKAEPPIEECVAAMNRAKLRGNTDWHVLIASKTDNLRFFYDETFAIGRLLIERERAAKGGA